MLALRPLTAAQHTKLDNMKGDDKLKWLKTAEGNLVCASLFGCTDPVRPGAADAVLKFRDAGLRMIVISGDSLKTATAIALIAAQPLPPTRGMYDQLAGSAYSQLTILPRPGMCVPWTLIIVPGILLPQWRRAFADQAPAVEVMAVATRKEAQSVFYRVCDPNAQRVLELLHDMFCPELGQSPSRATTSERQYE